MARPKPYDPVAADAERERIRETAKQTARNRKLGWVQRREARQLHQSLTAAEYEAHRKIKRGAFLCRCLNPDCLVWFASWKKTAHACSPECEQRITSTCEKWRSTYSFAPKALKRHAATVSRRTAGLYDSPKLTPYALRLVYAVEHDEGTGLDGILHAATMAAESRTRGIASSIADGTRERRFARLEDGDTFADFYLLGSDWAARHPHWPCDHSGLRSCQSPMKHYNTTTTP